ncbi:MAG: thiol peroxidase [Spirochaetaceae bacterium]|nr:MAG: thiol peroxidase [Spirochaetaceae bacterium]
MAKITVGGKPANTSGDLPATGSKAPDFLLTKGDLSDVSLKDFQGKRKILNIVTSLDTGTCATSAKKFEAEVARLANTIVLTVSCDLPFAQSRFCQSENIASVVTLSQLRNRSFGRDYGVEFVDGPLAGLFARSIVVLDENNKVLYTQQVPENGNEPDYASALKAARG